MLKETNEMSLLTIVILTKNEALNIVECVENAKQVTDDVLVIDSGSTDDTVQLAKTTGARVVYRAWDDDFAAQRNFAIENSDAEWILYLDADERLSDELIKSIKRALQDNKDECYEIKRINHAFGHRFKHGVYGPDKVTRMFKRTHFKYMNKVHEHAGCGDVQKRLTGVIEHYTTRTVEERDRKSKRYAMLWAQNAFEQGKRTNLIEILIHTAGAFIKVYVLQLGFLDGVMGFYVSVQHSDYTFKKYVRLMDLQQGRV